MVDPCIWKCLIPSGHMTSILYWFSICGVRCWLLLINFVVGNGWNKTERKFVDFIYIYSVSLIWLECRVFFYFSNLFWFRDDVLMFSLFYIHMYTLCKLIRIFSPKTNENQTQKCRVWVIEFDRFGLLNAEGREEVMREGEIKRHKGVKFLFLFFSFFFEIFSFKI